MMLCLREFLVTRVQNHCFFSLTISRARFNSLFPITFLPSLLGQGYMELWVSSVLKLNNVSYCTEFAAQPSKTRLILKR